MWGMKWNYTVYFESIFFMGSFNKIFGYSYIKIKKWISFDTLKKVIFFWEKLREKFFKIN